MITKKQWDRFIANLQAMKTAGYDMHFDGQKIVQVRPLESDFASTLYRKLPDGKFERVRFRYPDSISEWSRLDDLYRRVSIRLTLGDLRRRDALEQNVIDHAMAGGLAFGKGSGNDA